MRDHFLEDNTDTIKYLKSIPALKCFSEDDLKELLKVSEIATYSKNELIIEENRVDQRVFYLIKGKAKVVKNGREVALLCRTGDVFGEISIVAGITRSASVYATSQTTCLVVDLSGIDHLSECNRLTFKYMIYKSFAEIIANRLKITTEELIRTRKELEKYKAKGGRDSDGIRQRKKP